MGLCVMLPIGSIHAFEFETLFMPGDVIEGHKKLEKDCQQCHVRLRDTTQTQLCLDCHDDVENDINRKMGFHGIDIKVAATSCKTCHTDHKGRTATIIRLDKDRFDHAKTDFKLHGRHLQTECLSCHKPDKKYHEAPSLCIDCHKEDDVHKSQLGKQCDNCHTEKAWADRQFDHDSTDFKLRNTHKKQRCDSCHVNNQFKNTPKNCVSCHAIKDVHKNRFGNRCESCHRDSKWSNVKFEHNRDTSYKLAGKHRSQQCLACHGSRKPGSIQRTKKARNCYSCHRLDDVHQGSNGKKCQQCHSEKQWHESSFDHDNKTRFPLIGAHKEVRCETCHTDDSVDKKIDRDCYSCHKRDDVHKKQQGKVCDECHSQTSWFANVRFDHDISDFPLIGQHAAIGCESCHQDAVYKNTDSDCFSCHQSSDVHESALGRSCQQCHNPNDWLIWEFDHSKTDFKISGAHEGLHCHQCHINAAGGKKTTRNCSDCHHADDIHNGGFGKDCGRCHREDSFSSTKPSSLSSFSRKTSE